MSDTNYDRLARQIAIELHKRLMPGVPDPRFKATPVANDPNQRNETGLPNSSGRLPHGLASFSETRDAAWLSGVSKAEDAEAKLRKELRDDVRKRRAPGSTL